MVTRDSLDDILEELDGYTRLGHAMMQEIIWLCGQGTLTLRHSKAKTGRTMEVTDGDGLLVAKDDTQLGLALKVVAWAQANLDPADAPPTLRLATMAPVEQMKQARDHSEKMIAKIISDLVKTSGVAVSPFVDNEDTVRLRLTLDL
jgi:hypothetical protein